MLTISDLVNYILCLHVQIRLGFYFVNNIMTFELNALGKIQTNTQQMTMQTERQENANAYKQIANSLFV